MQLTIDEERANANTRVTAIRAAIMYWPRNQATRADWLAA